MSDPETLKVYADQAESYAKLTAGSALDDPMLASFITDLPENAHVLDIGCGPGNFASIIAAAGHRVTAIDPVAEMVTIANQHVGVTARQGSFDDITEKVSYNAIWANFSLLHAPRADLPKHLAAFKRALISPGILHVAVKTGTGEKRDALGRLYTYFTEPEMREQLSNAGFTIKEQSAGRDLGLDGTYADWIALRAYG